MNKFAIILSYVSIFSTVFSSVSESNLPELNEQILYSLLEDNLFQTVNNDLQQVINKLFSTLKLNGDFAQQYETRLLLSIFASLKGVSEKMYNDIKQVEKVSRIDKEFNKFDNNSLFKLDELIEDILITQNIPISNQSIHQNNVFKPRLNSIEIPEDSEEAVILLREYLINDQNVELADIEKPYDKIKKIRDKHKQFRRASNRNFKIWNPTNFSEFKLDTRRLYNSKQLKTKKYPFIASIHVRDQFVCTGAIISRDLVITAASCLNLISYDPKYLQEYPPVMLVRVGSDYVDKFGDVIEVINFYICPKYDEDTLKNNIAILKIKKHMHLKSNKIRRIGYQHLKANLPDFVHNVLLLGWGDEVRPSSSPKEDTLAISTLDIVKNINDCISVYTNKYVTGTNFCAGMSEIGAGACQDLYETDHGYVFLKFICFWPKHDIGGPAVVSSVLVGIVSFGPLVCGTPNAPTVFTNIGYYSNWIDGIINLQQKNKTMSKVSSNLLTNPNEEVDIDFKKYNLHDILRMGMKFDSQSNNPPMTISTTQTIDAFVKKPDIHSIESSDAEADFDDATFAAKSLEMRSTMNNPIPSRIPLKKSTTASNKKILRTPSNQSNYSICSEIFEYQFQNIMKDISKTLRQVLRHDDNKTYHITSNIELYLKEILRKHLTNPYTSAAGSNEIGVYKYTKGYIDVKESGNANDAINIEKTSDEKGNTFMLPPRNFNKNKLNGVFTNSTASLESNENENKKYKNNNDPTNSKELVKVEEDIKKTGDISMSDVLNITQMSLLDVKSTIKPKEKISTSYMYKNYHQKYVTRYRPTKTFKKFRHLRTLPQIHSVIYSGEKFRLRTHNKSVKLQKQALVTRSSIENLEEEIVRLLKLNNNIHPKSNYNSNRVLEKIHTNNNNNIKSKLNYANKTLPSINRGKKILKRKSKQMVKRTERNNTSRHHVFLGRYQNSTIGNSRMKNQFRYYRQDIKNLSQFSERSVSPVGMHGTLPYYEEVTYSIKRNSKGKGSFENRIKEIMNESEHYDPPHVVDYYYYLPSLEMNNTKVMKDFHEIMEEIEAGGNHESSSNSEDNSE